MRRCWAGSPANSSPAKDASGSNARAREVIAGPWDVAKEVRAVPNTN